MSFRYLIEAETVERMLEAVETLYTLKDIVNRHPTDIPLIEILKRVEKMDGFLKFHSETGRYEVVSDGALDKAICSLEEYVDKLNKGNWKGPTIPKDKYLAKVKKAKEDKKVLKNIKHCSVVIDVLDGALKLENAFCGLLSKIGPNDLNTNDYTGAIRGILKTIFDKLVILTDKEVFVITQPKKDLPIGESGWDDYSKCLKVSELYPLVLTTGGVVDNMRGCLIELKKKVGSASGKAASNLKLFAKLITFVSKFTGNGAHLTSVQEVWNQLKK